MTAKQYRATGRRKTAVARVILTSGKGNIMVNGRKIEEYFPIEYMRLHALEPLKTARLDARIDARVNIAGGGIHGQAGAMHHGLARALIEYDTSLRPELKQVGSLTRDSRKVERKKYGLHKARRAPQFSKR